MVDSLDIKRDDTPKSFFNPLHHAFILTYRDEDNKEETLTIPPLKLVTYPTYLADLIIKHLVTEIINERGLGYLTDEKRKEIEKETEV